MGGAGSRGGRNQKGNYNTKRLVVSEARALAVRHARDQLAADGIVFADGEEHLEIAVREINVAGFTWAHPRQWEAQPRRKLGRKTRQSAIGIHSPSRTAHTALWRQLHTPYNMYRHEPSQHFSTTR